MSIEGWASAVERWQQAVEPGTQLLGNMDQAAERFRARLIAAREHPQRATEERYEQPRCRKAEPMQVQLVEGLAICTLPDGRVVLGFDGAGPPPAAASTPGADVDQTSRWAVGEP